MTVLHISPNNMLTSICLIVLSAPLHVPQESYIKDTTSLMCWIQFNILRFKVQEARILRDVYLRGKHGQDDMGMIKIILDQEFHFSSTIHWF
jgi:hypothetical protein